ncbi:MAG: hypothetical protein GTO02_20795, partial [Candidatus Dadabacteria bacterium]|nr:hypothetical protein [Candidatus Dadabacteria bacterium]
GGEEFGGEAGGEFGEGFNNDVIDKLLVEGKRKNEDIKMMAEGIDDLLAEYNDSEDDEDIQELLDD